MCFPFLFSDFASLFIPPFLVVFEDYSEYESVDEEEPGPASVKAKAKAKAEEGDDESAPLAKPPKTTAAQKEPLKGKGAEAGGTKGQKQGSLAGFFTKPGGTKGGQKQGNLAGFFTAKPKK